MEIVTIFDRALDAKTKKDNFEANHEPLLAYS